MGGFSSFFFAFLVEEGVDFVEDGAAGGAAAVVCAPRRLDPPIMDEKELDPPSIEAEPGGEASLSSGVENKI